MSATGTGTLGRDKKKPATHLSGHLRVALASVMLAALGLGATSSAVPAFASVERSAARVDIIVAGGGIIGPDTSAQLSIVLRADETGVLGAGDITVTLTESRFTSEDQIRRFVAGTSTPVVSEVALITAPEIPQLESRELTMSLDPELWIARLPLDEPSNSSDPPSRQPGVFGLEVTYIDADNLNPSLRQLSGRQVIVVVPEDREILRANIAPIVALTTAADGGLALRPEELQALTIPGGPLDLVAEAARIHPATLAIDSRITSSIEILGDQAPAEALSWASTLGNVGLAQFALPWADADPLGSLAIDTLVYARLGKYPWIHGNAITADQLATLASRSASAVLLSSDAVPSDRAVVSFGGARIIRVDAQLSALATDALQAPTALESEADLQRAQGIIAYRAFSGNQEILVFSTGRLPATAAAPRIDAVLSRLVAMPVSNSVAVPLEAPATEELTGLIGGVPTRATQEFFLEVRELWEADVLFATIAADPESVVFGRWTRYQALLSSTWAENPNGLSADWERAKEDSRMFRNSVRVERGSAITVLSDQTSLPVTVVNDLNSDIVVILGIRPTTGILAVETPLVRLSVAANSSVRALVPVQSLANGTVPVEFSLVSSGGATVGEIVTIPVTIRAGWEGLISGALAVLVGGTFAFGLIRAIQRRRAENIVKDS
jgi:hypothetical protein